MAGNTPDAVVTPRIERYGARVLFVDDAGGSGVLLLLVRGHDPHRPERSFWFTPGGGIEHGETTREAAARELAEETGYSLEPSELVGPVWTRTAVFDFANRPYTQHEELFVGRLADAEGRPRVAAHFTEDEHDALDEVAWLTHAELAAEAREVFPDILRDSWQTFLAWDGVTRHLGVVAE